jgi:hypothetical protein
MQKTADSKFESAQIWALLKKSLLTFSSFSVVRASTWRLMQR